MHPSLTFAHLTFTQLSFTWPDGDTVVSDLSAELGPNRFGASRIGLVGSNGSGKSTLLRLISGALEPTSGSVVAHGRVEYLPQDPLVAGANTVAEALGVATVLEAIDAVTAGSVSGEHFDLIGNDWDIGDRSIAMLSRLGLDFALDRDLSELSGGELMLLSLAALLLREPDVLLLDEPTNNLDRSGRARLIEIVDQFSGLLIVASHDRELLEHVDRIAEVRDQSVRWFTGNFTNYERTIDEEQRSVEREIRDANSQVRKEKRQLVEAEHKLAQRQRYGKKMYAQKREPKIVMGARKRAAQESAGRLRGQHQGDVADAEATLAGAESRLRDDREIRLDLPRTAVPSSRVVLTVSEARLAHVDRTVSFSIHGPERIALAGPNGSGKTTLLKTALGQLSPLSGEVRLHVPAAYVPQRLNLLDPSRSVVENLAAFAPSLDRTELRAVLARLLFRGRKSDQSVESLSGGELLRAALACVLHADIAPQLLVLDEPTNNLDLVSVQHLVEALAGYEGALLVVSHDERFLDEIGVDRTVNLSEQPST